MRSKVLNTPLAVAFGIISLLHACGYRPMIASENSTRIMIPVFHNDTFEPALEAKLTRLVKQELLTRGGFWITQNPAQAHFILEGSITTYELSPLSFDQNFRTAEYRVNITVNIKVSKTRGLKVVWEQKGLKGSAEYVVSPDPGVSRSSQDLAINEAVQNIAEEIWLGISQLGLEDPL